MITINNFQQKSWQDFINVDLQRLLSDLTVVDTIDKYKISYSLLNKDQLQEPVGDQYSYIRDRKTLSRPILVSVKVELLDTKDFNNLMTNTVNILEIPTLTDSGFIIDGDSYDVVTEFRKAYGWSINDKKELELTTKRGGKIKFTVKNNKMVVEAGRGSVPVGVFLRALTKYSYEDLGEILKDYSNVVNKELLGFGPTYEEAIRDTLAMFETKNLITQASADLARSLQERFFSGKYMQVGKESRVLLSNLQSFTRYVGHTLAQDTINLHAGDILTIEEAHQLDNSDVTAIQLVKSNGKSISLPKCKIEDNLTPEEIMTVFKIYLAHLEGIGTVPDPDSFENKIVSPISHQFLQKVEENINKLSNSIRNKLRGGSASPENLIDEKAFSPTDYLANFKRESSTAMTEDTNIYAPVAKGYKMNSAGSSSGNATKSQRDIKPSQYGRVCPIESPESAKIGLVSALTLLSEVDELGFVTTPYFNPKTNEIVYLNAAQERGKVIATYDADLTKESVLARVEGNPRLVPSSKVDLQDVSPLQVFGPSVMFTPFGQNDKGKRLLTPANQLRQAVVPVRPERPVVGTGIETLFDNGVVRASQVLERIENQNGLTKGTLKDHAVKVDSIQTLSGSRELYLSVDAEGIEFPTVSYNLATFQGTTKHTSIHYQVNGAGPWKGNEIVYYGHGVDVEKANLARTDFDYGKGINITPDSLAEKSYALGKNMKVLFKMHEGFGFEDAIIINADFVNKQAMTISSINTIRYKLNNEKKNKSENFSKMLHGTSSQDTDHLQMNGLPKKGTYLVAGQIVIGVDRQVTLSEDNKVKETQRNGSVRLKQGYEGYVVDSYIRHDTAYVTIASLQDLQIGDKLAGRHGNKGVLAKIVSPEDMPYMEDGTIPDIIMNPLGVPSRMNLGQLIEAMLGWAFDQTGQVEIVEPFTRKSVDYAFNRVEELGLKPQTVYDGRTGQPFPRPMYYGIMYVNRLEHMVANKIHSTNLIGGNLNPVTLQGKAGRKNDGAQKVSELNTWAHLAHNAPAVLESLFSLQGDDVIGKEKLRKKIEEDVSSIQLEGNNQADTLLLPYLRSVGYNLTSDDNGRTSLAPMRDKDILNLTSGELNCNVDNRVQELHKEVVFGKQDNPKPATLINARKRYGHIDFGLELVMPVWLESHTWTKAIAVQVAVVATDSKGMVYLKESSEWGNMSVNKFKKLIDGTAIYNPTHQLYLEIKNHKGIDLTHLYDKEYLEDTLTGMEAVVALVKDSHFCLYFRGEPVMKFEEGEYKINPKLEYEPVTLSEEGRTFARQDLLKEYIRPAYLAMTLAKNYKPSDYVNRYYTIMPAGLRPSDIDDPNSQHISQVDIFYTGLMSRIVRIQDNPSSRDYFVRELFNYLKQSKSTSKGKDTDYTLMRDFTDHSTKNSVLRDNLMSKRVDFSGRSVIVVNPKLRLNQVGVPITMAMKLWEPHLNTLTKNTPPPGIILESNTVKKLIQTIRNNDLTTFANTFCADGTNPVEEMEKAKTHVLNLLTQYTRDKVVELNREPSLHKFSVQGFYPVLVEGLAIQLHPLMCKGFNADFDGDQMMIVLPVTDKANKEVERTMLVRNNIINPGDGEIILDHSQDMILGAFAATMYKGNKNPSPNGNLHSHLNIKLHQSQHVDYISEEEVKVEGYFNSIKDIQTELDLGNLTYQDFVVYRHQGDSVYFNTVGRILINALIPMGRGFENGQLRYDCKFDKGTMKRIVRDVYDNFPVEDTLTFYDELMDFTFKASDLSGISLHALDFQSDFNPETVVEQTRKEEQKIYNYYEMGHISAEERSKLNIDLWEEARESVRELISEKAPRDNNLYIIMESGARGGMKQYNEAMGIIGTVTNANNEPMESPITASYLKGLHPTEYFTNSYNTRLGQIATALETRNSGELTRSIVYALESLRVVEKQCDSEGKVIQLPADTNYLLNRNSEEYGDLTQDVIDTLPKEGSLTLHTTLTCNSDEGVCQRCFGLEYDTNKHPHVGQFVGFKSAQALGEPSTQLTLDTFHAGADEDAGSGGLDQVKALLRMPNDQDGLEMFDVKNATLAAIKNSTGVVERVDEIKEKSAVTLRNIKLGNLTFSGTKEFKIGELVATGKYDFKMRAIFEGIEEAQEKLLQAYNSIYEDKGVNILKRHYELLVYMQTRHSIVTSSKEWNYPPGSIELTNKLQGLKLKYQPYILGQADILRHVSNTLTALASGNLNSFAVDAVINNKKDKPVSALANLAVGNSLTNTDNRKKFQIANKEIEGSLQTKEKKNEEVVSLGILEKNFFVMDVPEVEEGSYGGIELDFEGLE